MPPSVFALFVDVMGVQRDLLSTGAEATKRFDRCRERLEDFRRDLFFLINQQLPMLLLRSDVPEPTSSPNFPTQHTLSEIVLLRSQFPQYI
jgi:hypothetical protein